MDGRLPDPIPARCAQMWDDHIAPHPSVLFISTLCHHPAGQKQVRCRAEGCAKGHYDSIPCGKQQQQLL